MSRPRSHRGGVRAGGADAVDTDPRREPAAADGEKVADHEGRR